MRLIHTPPIAIASLILSGCTPNLNDRPTLGGSYQSPSINPSGATVVQHDAPSMMLDRHPDRSRWEPTQFVAHFDGVAHGQSLVLPPPLTTEMPPRMYGRFPSEGDVLDAQTRSWGDELMAWTQELGRSTIGSAYAIGYLAWNNLLGRASYSPTPYKRSDQDQWSSGSPEGSQMEKKSDDN